ncbi:MAG: lyase family protein [Candidatus Nealsonbacteria bacterium]|nr:lyase family protein [Candidatus Nealsonbacteria bacterium]
MTEKEKKEGLFDNVSPIDYRYREHDLLRYLSEEGFIEQKLNVEEALIVALRLFDVCDCPELYLEFMEARKEITAKEVYAEEKRIKHDIRALVNCIRKRVSDGSKPYVHMTATSFDIVDTANAARFKKAIEEILLPDLISLEKTLIEIAYREAGTIQIGRTHGQHAVPITFGFAIASYVSRLGECILSLKRLNKEQVGKFSGAVGAYNASSLFVSDPEEFEKCILEELATTEHGIKLKPAEISTQIVPPEPTIRIFAELVLIGGVLANLSRDMRHLQRTEIGEVGEEFSDDQVGSSTMPQKRNPINFENVESLWKVLVGHLTTVYLNQISEHQRDLTNSAAERTYPETIAYLVSMTRRINKTMKKLRVDKANIQRNFDLQKDLIIAEPLYIILSALDHPDAHEKVRQLTLKAQETKNPLQDLAMADNELKPYFEKMSLPQKRIISDPTLYTGIAEQKAKKVAISWAQKLNLKGCF